MKLVNIIHSYGLKQDNIEKSPCEVASEPECMGSPYDAAGQDRTSSTENITSTSKKTTKKKKIISPKCVVNLKRIKKVSY